MEKSDSKHRNICSYLGAECSYKLKDKNNCVLVDGMMTIVSLEEDIQDILDDVKESLFEAMDRGDFVDSSLGIVRVSPASVPILDEGLQEDTDSSVIDGEDTDIVRPVSDKGSMLGIVSICGAGALLFVVAASIYRRRKSLKSNDASTLQDGVTMNGLSRFDVTHDDPGIEDMNIDDVEILPLSPAARTISDHRYTSDGGRILTLGR